jgi:transposase
MLLPLDERERIRRAYHLEGKSIRQISRETGHCRDAIRRAITDDPSQHPSSSYPEPRPSSIFRPFQKRIEALLIQNDHMPKKQQYTTHKMFELLREEGYTGSESRIRQYVAEWKRAHQTPKVFLPLEYEPGKDAQCDWGEAVAVIGGVRQTVQVFVMRLCYSRRTFVMTFPSQNQECLLVDNRNDRPN